MSRKVSLEIPICIPTLTDQNRHEYLELFRSVSAGRVWLAGYDELLFEEDPAVYAATMAHLRDTVRYFRENGLEVGAWVRDLGFGTPMRQAANRAALRRGHGADGRVSDGRRQEISTHAGNAAITGCCKCVNASATARFVLWRPPLHHAVSRENVNNF